MSAEADATIPDPAPDATEGPQANSAVDQEEREAADSTSAAKDDVPSPKGEDVSAVDGGAEGEAAAEEEEVEEEMLPDPEQEAAPSRPGTPVDLRQWMLQCIRERISLPRTSPAMVTADAHFGLIEPFFTAREIRLLTFQLVGDALVASTSVPTAVSASEPMVYFVRTSAEPVMYGGDFDASVQSGAVRADYLQSLARRMNSIYSPMLAHGANWPDSVRNEFASGINRFMSVLTDTALKGQGQTVLYVPAERLIGDVPALVADRELVQRLEATVIHWTRQIKGVLSSNQPDGSQDNTLPLEEVRFWQKRCQDLSGIGDQLEKPGVRRIIELLQAANSSYLQQFNTQVRLIKDGIVRAESNHKFLSVLKQPCEGLIGAHLKTLPSLLPQIIDLIRLIWLHSPYYNDTLSITSLFQKVSSAVILRCQDCISLPDVFGGDTHGSEAALTDAIACCEAYKATYTARAKAHDSQSSIAWDVNYNSVFAEVDSFTQLCSDLLEVVASQSHFAPPAAEGAASVPFAGTKGAELQKSIRGIELQFTEALKALATVSADGSFAEITPATWSAAFGRFKKALKDTEARMQSVIAAAFETVHRVEAGVEIVETFQALASREMVRRTLQKHTRWLFELFGQQVDGVKKKFAAERSNPPLGPGVPRQAGSAIWATLLREQLERPYTILSQANFLHLDDFAQEVLHSYSLLSGSFKEYVTKTYNLWVSTLGHDLITKLSQPLMKRGPDRSMLLLNFDHTLMVVFAEIHHWQKLGFAVPSLATEVYHKKEAMRTLRGHVMLVVRDYNAIIERLSAEERLLFRERIRFLDRKVQPGLAKLQWASPGIQEYYVADARKHSYKIKAIVDKYMSANERIAKLCKAVSQVSMVSVSFKDLTSHIAFAEAQDETMAAAVNMLVRLHREVVKVMQKTYEVFKGDGLDVQQHWLKYTVKIDKMLEAALKVAVKTALHGLSGAINGNGKSAASPLFRINVVLEGDEVQFQPSYPHLGEVVTGVVEKVTESLRELQRLPSLLARGAKAQLPFADAIAGEDDVGKLVRSIRRGLRDNGPNMFAYQTTWQEKYSGMWLTDKEEFLRQYERSSPPLSKFDADVGSYGEVANNVQKEDTLMAINFCMLDCTMLKYSLVEHCNLWQRMFTQLLCDMACKELAALREHMAERGQRLLKVPQSLDDMVESLQLMDRTNGEMATTESRFEPLNQQFAILDRYGVEVPDQVREDLLTVPQQWTVFQKSIGDSSTLLEGAKKKFKASLVQSMDNLTQQVAGTRTDWLENGPFSAASAPSAALEQLMGYRARIKEIADTRASLEAGLQVFDVRQEPFQAIKDTEKDLSQMETLWGLANDWETKAASWKETVFGDIATDEMEMQAQQQLKKVVKMGREVKDKDWEMVTFYRSKIDTFKKVMPLIQDLKNPALRPRHWENLQQQVGKAWDPASDDFTLGKILDLGLDQFVDEVSEISGAASKELSIEESIAEIGRIWEDVVLEVVPFKDAGHHILRAGEELFQTLEDNQVTLSTMKASRFVKAFLKDVDFWERTLSLILEVVEMTLTVQRQWMYLENIFQGEDIRKQLPSESAKFDDINRSWMEIMTRMKKQPKAKPATHVDGLLARLTKMNEVLEQVQKSLDEYLETKRQCFPRFYFVSNDDLLEVLGQSRNPENVQPHLLKCFDAVKKMELALPTGKRVKECIGIHSSCGEYVPYAKSVVLDGPVEGWLCLVEDEMKRSLASTLSQSLVAHKKTKDKEAWIKQWPGQLVMTVSQMVWTADCVKAMSDKVKGGKKGLKSLKKKQVHLLSKLTDMVRAVKNKTQRKKIVALITVEVHSRDVIDKLAKVNDIDDTAFEWLMQLRFYWEKDQGANGDCVIRQTNTRFTYGYEYIGNAGRLVITPLTDRCYMTLTTALHLKRGGSPKGPAGTGKTETVKDLGKAMGDYVIVVNCSEGLDYKSLGRMFSGLAQTGAWGCFDEFNRINIEVLSVVAQQILSILSAQIPLSPDNVETRFVFEGSDIRLKWSCGVFITMNPGYAGRTELPDNLKSMFRPISMMVPDTGLIAEIILFGQGFDNTRVLAKKADTMYVLARQQLSKQDHYDFGLRSMVSTLLYAGRKRQEMPTVPQEEIVLLAMKDMNIAKMTGNDLPLFKGIMADLFPGVELTPIDYGPFRVAIEDQLREQGYQVSDWICQKVIELFETKNSRHSVMIVGLSGSAKSVSWRTLKRAMTACHKQGHAGYMAAKEFCINPKALSLAELYGEFDFTTNEWADGVLSSVMRDVCADEKPDQKWILFDAPVDTLWIESMNSTMDDNKILTLINGERISMPQQVSLLFEVEDLAVASPATVSRCGMVYHDTVDLGWRPYVASWLDRQKDEKQRALLQKLFDKYVDRLSEFVEDKCTELVKQQSLTRVMSLCKLLETLLASSGPSPGEEAYERMLEQWFLFSCVWSILGGVDEDGRKKADNFVREIEGQFPGKDTIFEYFVDTKNKNWGHWDQELKANWRYAPGTPFHKIQVPTVDTVRYGYLAQRLVQNNKPFLVTGPVGTGKTSVVTDVLRRLDPEVYSQLVINMSSKTSSNNVQEIIEGRVEKRTKGVFVPAGGKQMVTFLDDLNMPAKDEFGSQPPLELLRLWQEYGFWYDRRKQTTLSIKDMRLCAAMGPPGGGRMVISRRLQSRFNLINMTFPANSQIKRIFGTMISQHLQDFDEGCKAVAEMVTTGTIDVYNFISQRMLPTPAKIHYLFNLRDISKVFQGLLRSHKDFHDTKEGLSRLWVHECARVFRDRLIDDKDNRTFDALVSEKLGEVFDLSYDTLCPDGTPFFSDYLREGQEAVYEDADTQKIRGVLEEKLEDYNNSGFVPMDLVLFQDAVDHVCRIVRVLRTERGNMLLIGVGGSGRQSLARLASFVLEYKVFQIEVTKHYKNNEFREDLMALYKQAGLENKPTAFLFVDTQIVVEDFLEDINNILSSGEVPNLFDKDSLEEVFAELGPIAKKEGVEETPTELYRFFIDRVRNNLHVVLCMSPVGEAFRNRMRMYPGLVNCTTIDYFAAWPEEALLAVANKYLDEVKFADEEAASDALRLSISKTFAVIQQSVITSSNKMLEEMNRHNYVTPTNYLELVTGYRELLSEKRAELNDAVSKYDNGLEKLDDTRHKVEIMGVELEAQTVKVAEFQRECDEYLVVIVQQKREADDQQKAVSIRSEKIAEDAKQTAAIAADAQADLDEALPALEAAMTALNSLNKQDITEIKSYSKPPPLVELVLSAVMTLRRQKTDWADAKKAMGESGFIKQLIDFDKDHMSDRVLKAVAGYVKNPQFHPDIVGKVSNAAKSLCMWVRAMDVYGRVFKQVEPKRKALEAAQATLKAKEASLQEAQAKLQEVTDKVNKLQADYEEKLAKKEELRVQAEMTSTKLDRAGKLVSGLAGEKVRWESSSKALKTQISFLVGDCLLASGFMSYLGPFISEYRDAMVNKSWKPSVREQNIPCDPNFSTATFLAKPTDVRFWNIQGLPSDTFSTENGVIVTRGRRWPLMVDPQGQAIKWIKNMERERGLKVVDLQQADYLRTLENAIQFGTPVLMQNVAEELDPSLAPILNKAFVKVGGRLLLKLGDKEIEYSPDFRFYITTKMSNPHYTPEISTKATIVNFAVVEQGLEAQLLGIVVSRERPDLEEQKNELVMKIAAGKKKLVDLEDKILHLLSTAKGSLLDDTVLVETLNSSKVTSVEVTEQLAIAETTEKEIDDARELYRPSANRSSILFFVLNDIGKIDPMYQFSLDSYIALFNMSIKKSTKSPELAVRIDNINDYHTYATYRYICRGLFEKHKLLFAFHMTAKILESAHRLNMPEFNMFLRGGQVLDRDSQTPNPHADWINADAWDSITEFDRQLPKFSGLAQSFEQLGRDWRRWYISATPETEALPGEWENACNELQRMLLVRALRADRVSIIASSFIVNNLGARFVEPPPLNMKQVLDDSTAATPLIFVLSPGVDPTASLIDLAAAEGMTERFHSLSLGQGQAPIAERMIEEGAKQGHWVFLANCHLSLSWMPALSKRVEMLEVNKPHKDFRLWLSSSPDPRFPISILQAGIKMTTEPPKGIKANMQRLYLQLTEESFGKCAAQHKYKRLMFCLTFFHSILIERRKFRMLGWNVDYPFNDSDFLVSNNLLTIFLDEYEETPWDALKYLISGINYGGHVTDDWDRRVMITYINDLFVDDVLATENFKVSQSDVFHVPADGDLQSYRDYVNTLPNVDPPEAFGQNSNADISSMIRESRVLLGTLVSLQPAVSSEGGQSNEDKVLDLAADMAERLPDVLDYKATAALLQDEPHPLNVVLLQEIERYNALLTSMRKSLVAVQKGIKGLVVMSTELEDMFTCFLNGLVPAQWRTTYPSQKPLAAWMRDLIERVAFFSDWATSGRQPVIFWMSAFTFPTGFLTAVLQHAARQNSVAVDTLSWDFSVVTQEDATLTEQPKDGVYIRGLFLEGASWDKAGGHLVDAAPMQLVSPMPTMLFRPTEKKKSAKGNFVCPCYYYPNRTGEGGASAWSFVIAVDLKGGEHTSEYWIKLGVALLMSLES